MGCWYLEESSLKWAMVIHQLPSSPPETPCIRALAGVPQDAALLLDLPFILSLHLSCVSAPLLQRGFQLDADGGAETFPPPYLRAAVLTVFSPPMT